MIFFGSKYFEEYSLKVLNWIDKNLKRNRLLGTLQKKMCVSVQIETSEITTAAEKLLYRPWIDYIMSVKIKKS